MRKTKAADSVEELATMASKPRPTGVKVITGLEIIVGLIMILIGSTPLIGTILSAGQFGLAIIVLLPILLIASLSVLLVMIVIGVLFFLLARRLWKGGATARRVALALTIVGSALSVLFGFGGGYAGAFIKNSPSMFDYLALFVTISGTIINASLLYFLTRRDVKDFFKG